MSTNDTTHLQTIQQQLNELYNLTVRELMDKHVELTGESTRSRNKDYLRKKLAWKIQERAEGGLSQKAQDKIDELAKVSPGHWRRTKTIAESSSKPTTKATKVNSRSQDPRLPAVGTVLNRIYKKKSYSVEVAKDGFIYNGEHYKTLSKVAQTITGTHWNGFSFFGLKAGTK